MTAHEPLILSARVFFKSSSRDTLYCTVFGNQYENIFTYIAPIPKMTDSINLVLWFISRCHITKMGIIANIQSAIILIVACKYVSAATTGGDAQLPGCPSNCFQK